MDNIPEGEQPRPESIISLGEDFQPFDPSYTKQEQSVSLSVNIFKSQIKLSLADSLEIPFEMGALASRSSKGDAITPFDPELGYQIDSEDLNLESRLGKEKRLQKELWENIDFRKAPLYLYTRSYNFKLNKLGLNKEVGYSYRFDKEQLDFFEKLRLYVFFPRLRFEARPWDITLSQGEISLDRFYPIDTGPLPTTKYFSEREGFNLYLPSDPAKLAQIRARFVIAEEQPDENPNNQAPNPK